MCQWGYKPRYGAQLKCMLYLDVCLKFAFLGKMYGLNASLTLDLRRVAFLESLAPRRTSRHKPNSCWCLRNSRKIIKMGMHGTYNTSVLLMKLNIITITIVIVIVLILSHQSRVDFISSHSTSEIEYMKTNLRSRYNYAKMVPICESSSSSKPCPHFVGISATWIQFHHISLSWAKSSDMLCFFVSDLTTSIHVLFCLSLILEMLSICIEKLFRCHCWPVLDGSHFTLKPKHLNDNIYSCNLVCTHRTILLCKPRYGAHLGVEPPGLSRAGWAPPICKIWGQSDHPNPLI